MGDLVLPNLPDKIICKILEFLGEETFYYLGDFLRSGKCGYAFVHEPSVLKICDVGLMVTTLFCHIGSDGKFREFLLKCIDAGNIRAIYYAGIQAAPSTGLEESIKILEPNVHIHGLSKLAVGIFSVCLGKHKETSKVFQHFEANHHNLRSDALLEMGENLEWLLLYIGAPYLASYGQSFKFPDDEVIKRPKCLLEQENTPATLGICKNCILYCTCLKVSYTL